MRSQKLPMPERLFIAIGLLCVTMPTLINDWIKIPDFVRGFFVGLGLVAEVAGFIKLRRRQKADAAC